MRFFVTIAEKTTEVEVRPDGIFVGERRVEADLVELPGTNVLSLILDGVSYRVQADSAAEGRWELEVAGHRYEAEVIDERTRVIREMTGIQTGPSGPKPVTAPMPGLVVKVEVGEGDTVEEGQGLIIVEAMKMENELNAVGPAIVGLVRVEVGQTVEKGQVLIELRPVEAPQ